MCFFSEFYSIPMSDMRSGLLIDPVSVYSPVKEEYPEDWWE